MANDKNHIDQLLKSKLGSFENAPDDKAMDKLLDYLDHNSHDIDLGLSSLLTNIEASPDEKVSKKVLENIGGNPLGSDLRLHALLSSYQEQPDIPFNPKWAKVKTRSKWPILLVALISLASLIFNQSIRSPETKEFITVNSGIKPSEKKHEGLHENEVNVKSENLIDEHTNLYKNKYTGTQRTNQAIVFDDIKEPSEMGINANDNNYEYLLNRLLPIKTFEIEKWEIKPLQTSDYKFKKLSLPKLLAAPIQIGLWSGYYLENRLNSHTSSDKVHKDYIKLYEQGDAELKSGKSVLFSVQYQIGKRFGIQAGYHYSTSSAQTQMQYVYTDIPVYDSTGKIHGYIQRPASSSPKTEQNVTSKSSTSAFPVQMNMTFIGFGKWTISGGLGVNLQMHRKIEYSNFNFQRAVIDKKIENSGFKINPMANLMLRRQFGDQIALGFNWQFNPQGLQINDQNAQLKGTILRSSFQLGLLYTPLIKIP